MRGSTQWLTLGCLFAAAGCAIDAAPDIESPSDGDGGAPVPYWATNSVSDEAGSTHLWIVDRAGDVLGAHLDNAYAARARKWLTNPSCVPRWQQGLYDADYRHQYNGGWFDLTPTSSTAEIAASGATWAAHFYDPDTGRNYEGDTSPTAKTEALSHLSSAKKRLASSDVYNGCYELGLALHFFTDLTQPMHASNFTATDRPLKLHTNVEEYAISLQTGGAPAGWTAPTGKVATFIDAAGHRSKNQWPGLKSAIAASYDARCGSFYYYLNDDPSCWQHDATVDGDVVASMASAINDTARFLVIAQLP